MSIRNRHRIETLEAELAVHETPIGPRKILVIPDIETVQAMAAAGWRPDGPCDFDMDLMPPGAIVQVDGHDTLVDVNAAIAAGAIIFEEPDDE